MDEQTREHFDGLLERVLGELPEDIHRLLEEVPLVVEDHPSPEVVEAFELESPDELCGMHDGIPLPERSVEGGGEGLPDHIMIYRLGVMAAAEGEAGGAIDDFELDRQIRITVLHEIGHHFGMDEAQLDELGYG